MMAIGSAANLEEYAKRLAGDIVPELRLIELDIAGWQSVLDRNAEIFGGMAPGAKVGVLSKDDFEPPNATMLVWEATQAGMRAYYHAFPGFESVELDLLFIADDPTIRRIYDPSEPGSVRRYEDEGAPAGYSALCREAARGFARSRLRRLSRFARTDVHGGVSVSDRSAGKST